MKRTNLISLTEAMADLNNTTEAFDMWKVSTFANCDSIEEYEEATLNEEYWRSEKIANRPLYDIYTCNDKQYVARNLNEAYLMALCEQGIDAIGKGISCENGDFMLNVCLNSYKKYFPNFTENDFLIHMLTITYAWNVFDKKTYTDYDGCKCTQLCKAGLDFIQENSALARYMEENNFEW